MFWNLWAFCHHLTLLTEWSVGRSFEKNAAGWNPTGARDQNRKWWESTPSLAAAVGEYIYSNHLCPLFLYAWELFFCYHFKRNSAARKYVRKTEKTKKTVARKHTPIPKSATARDQLSPTPLVGDVNEECVCGAGASDGFPDGWTEPESRDREVSSTFLGLNGRRVVSRAQLGQSAGAWRRARVFTAAHLSSCSSLFWDFFGDWHLWWSETRRCEWWPGMWKDKSAATSENIFSLILKQFGSYGKTQQVCWLSQLLA